MDTQKTIWPQDSQNSSEKESSLEGAGSGLDSTSGSSPGANSLRPFDEWVLQNLDEITQAQELTKSLYPDNPVELASHLSRAQSEYARMGYLLADAECHVIMHRASETIKARSDLAHLSGPERKVIVEARIKDVIRMRDNLQVVVSSLKQKCFGAMNLRKVHNAETVV